MAFVKKLVLGSIFISILSIFAMSHNANAVDFTINYNNYEIVRHSNSVYIGCRVNGNTLSSEALTCTSNSVLSGPSYLQEIRYSGDYHWETGVGVKKGDLLEWYLIVFTNQNYTINGMVRGPQFISTYSYLDTISVEEIVDTSFYQEYSETCTMDNTLMNCYTSDGYKIFKIYRIIQRVNSNITERWTYGLNNTSTYRIFEWYESIAGTVRFRIVNFNQYRFVGSEENKEQEEKTQEAVDESQAAGSGSSSSASQGGANLLSAITGFFNVITSAQPTNCRFNAPLNTYFGNQNLNVDLCALDLPQGIGALTSIIAIGILIPFAIHMFNKFIALFRSFQS